MPKDKHQLRQKDSPQDFTTRSVMALVVESSELTALAVRFSAIVTALALAHGVSTDV